MKKLVSLMLAALMLFAMVPAVAESIPTGTWYLVEIIREGESVNPSMIDLSASVVLNEDGSARLLSTYGEETEEISAVWAADGNQITVTEEDGEETKFDLEGDRLNMKQVDGIMSFSQDPEAPSILAIHPVTAESEEDFLGNWTVAQVGVMGSLMYAENVGISRSLVIEPGQAAVSYDGETVTGPTVLQDGQLKIVYSDGSERTIVLNDNGQLSETMDSAGQELILYFAKTEE